MEKRTRSFCVFQLSHGPGQKQGILTLKRLLFALSLRQHNWPLWVGITDRQEAPQLRLSNQCTTIYLKIPAMREHVLLNRSHRRALDFCFRVSFCEKPVSTFSRHALACFAEAPRFQWFVPLSKLGTRPSFIWAPHAVLPKKYEEISDQIEI